MFKFNFNRKKTKTEYSQDTEELLPPSIDEDLNITDISSDDIEDPPVIDPEDNDSAAETDDDLDNHSKLNSLRNESKPKIHLSKKFKIVIISILSISVLLGVAGFLLLSPNSKPNEPAIVEVVDETIQVRDSISMQVKIGTPKSEILTKFNIPSDKAGVNHVTLEAFNRILDSDFLTTFIFKDDVLVATVHERIMDGSQKNSLAVETQAFIANLAENYKIDNTTTLKNIEYKWLGLERKYDNSAWNSAIVNNELEIFSNIEYNNESIQVVSSGINYFNFLAKQRKSTTIGNMVIVYTDVKYKDDFSKFAALAI